ncbi:MAG TPA: hydroxymethylglutaryl-CoA reductase [Ilumatobacteraceae bacterium]|nr:hydroxymethylglutaryl-CoA reductase [Ilumatobacteraceae bacterium]
MTEPSGHAREPIPRDTTNDYTAEQAERRRAFVEAHTGARLDHVGRYSFDPATLPGNIENFLGIAQVPIGVAGPLRINGEHAQGDFYIPLATTEGTLVASYNRGMRVLSECGGVTTTVVGDSMQRAPAFVLPDALHAREFGAWVDAHLDQIRSVAEATTRSGRLTNVTQHAVGPIRFLRCNYTTGDAAGQNMTGKATLAACEWIRANYPGELEYVLSGNVDTDKKHSAINTLLTRGKRVVAEATLDRRVLAELMGVDTRTMFRWRQVSNVGALLSGAANNGAHAANGIAALFIATGQDVANVAESHAAITYSQLLDDGNYYWSVTIPSLIVATYGGGTGLATQRECLDMLGCYGAGNVAKFAEIVAAVVLAGDISLSAAVLHGDWVSSHDALGRNRP